MFTGTKVGTQGGGTYLKTGLSSFEFLGVNPTADQIKEWTGRENVNEPNYDLAKDYNEKDVRPINLWLRNEDGVVTSHRINIGSDDAIAGSGNYKVCTSTGAVVWAKSGNVLKPEFADHKALKIGEADLIAFISKLINFDTKSGENLYQQMTELKVDANSLFNGSYTGLNNVAKQYTKNRISMVLIVREKDALDDTGNNITKRYQGIASSSETWFHGEVSEWAKNNLLTRYEKSLVVGAGQTKAYPLIKELFTIEYQDFKKEDCYNAEPENPVVATGW